MVIGAVLVGMVTGVKGIENNWITLRLWYNYFLLHNKIASGPEAS